MSRESNRPRPGRDPDGVRIDSARGLWTRVAAIGLGVLAVLAIVLRFALRPDARDARERDGVRTQAGKVMAAAKAAQPMRVIPVRRADRKPSAANAGAVATSAPETPTEDPGTSTTPGPTAMPKPTLEPGWEATLEEPVVTEEDLNRPTPEPSDYGWTGEAGMALFPPPGTNPPKPGIIVPEGVELPPGYVRHHQTNDDGTDLGAILMFNPDYDFVDQNGNPVRIPEDRIVPPDMVPPGIPVEVLEIPEVDYGPSREDLQNYLKEHPELLSEGSSPEDIERALLKQQQGVPKAPR